jgi:hypothetical protein
VFRVNSLSTTRGGYSTLGARLVLCSLHQKPFSETDVLGGTVLTFSPKEARPASSNETGTQCLTPCDIWWEQSGERALPAVCGYYPYEMHIEETVQSFYIVHRTCISKEWNNEGKTKVSSLRVTPHMYGKKKFLLNAILARNS